MTDSASDFFIVGIGASAGGIQALEEFFSNITDHPNAAFVVLQHLSPDFRSMMSEILQRKTVMQVRQVEDGMPIEAGTVYVMPPGKNLLLQDRQFVLAERSAHLNYPINLFFESMARDFAERAIGVVLTGGGSDGTEGLQRISRCGGVVLVQTPESAQFSSMPVNAIASGIVDKILSPKELALAVYDIVRFTYDQNPRASDDEDFVNSSELQEIIELLADQADVDFSEYKTNTLRRRTRHRCALNRCETIVDYINILHESEEERKLLRQSLLIGATRFFRDGTPWVHLENSILPQLINKLNDGEQLRIWATACSTGEEAYTIAMVVNDALEAANKHLKVKIFTTDIDPQSLSFAAKGSYPANIASDISPDRLARYFEETGGKYQVKKHLREMLIIAPHDLTKNAGFSKMHIVFCRNVLIYMKPKLQQQVLRLLHFTLAPEGFLFLGSSETLGEYDVDFETLHADSKIYQKKRNGRRLLPTMNVRTSSASFRPHRPATQQRVKNDTVVKSAFRHAFGDRKATCMLVNQNNQLLRIFYNSAELLQLSVGEVQMNVVDMMPKALRLPLETALHRAKREKEAVVYTGIALPSTTESDGSESDQAVQSVDLRIGFESDDARKTDALVVMLEIVGTKRTDEKSPAYDISADATEQISALEYELKQTKENLQVTIEELETINEEQQATNEELLASNEELQSTNEEMQSVNEELYTVNSEYQQKIQELVQLNEDIDNLLRSTNIGVVFLDRDLHIRKFTPAAAAVVSLREGDIDRPISDFTSRLNDVDLEVLANDVLKTKAEVEREVLNTETNESLLLRAYPYMKTTGELDGVVLTFLEVTELKRTQMDLQESKSILETVYATSPVGFALHDEQLRFVRINQTLAEIDRLPVEEHIGKKMNEVLPSDIGEEAMKLHRQVLDSGEPILDYQFEGTLPTEPDSYRYWSASYFPVELQNGRRWVAAVVNEVTKMKRVQLQLQESQNFASRLSESNPGIIYIFDVEAQKNVYLNSSVQSILGYTPEEVQEMGDQMLGMLTHPSDLTEMNRYFQQFDANSTGVLETEVRIKRRDDSWCWLALRSVVFSYNESGAPQQILGLCTDITMRKRTERRLKGQKQALETAIASAQAADSANQAKSEFLANMSHEIRTPMNLILGASQLLEKTELSKQQQDLLSVLRRNGDTLLTLINDVLDLSKLEAYELRIDVKPFALSTMLRTVVSNFRPVTKEKELSLQLTVDDSLPERVVGDSFRLQQVLRNLIGNAVKFTEEGHISINVGIDNPDDNPDETLYVRFEIEDTGIGIASDEQNDLFEPFVQADASSTRQYGGTGLGLTISRRIVELMEGEIGVESTLNEGATFWFVVPFERERRHESRENALSAAPGLNSSEQEKRLRTRQDISILVAEDNADNREVAVMLLEGLDYGNVETVNNGKELLEKIALKPYDLILMDCQMPEVDGYEATLQLRSQPSENQNTPVVAMTAHAMQGDREQCLAVGMNDYLSKPLMLDQMATTIDKWTLEQDTAEQAS